MSMAMESPVATDATVFVVDDKDEARGSVCALVESMGIEAEAYSSAEEFLEKQGNVARPSCIVTDLQMLGMSGLELQDRLRERNSRMPVIVVTAYAQTPTTVRAMRNGAIACLDKPYADNDLWDTIREGINKDAEQRAALAEQAEILARLDTLTFKEKQVLQLVVNGKPNKVIAKLLEVSLRTVENRRRHIFIKMKVDSVAELVQLIMKSQRDI